MSFSSKKLNMLIGKKYSALQEEKTLRTMASEIGISPGYLALLRNGKKSNPGPSTLVKLATFFEVNPDEFMTDQNADDELSKASMQSTLNLCDDLISTGNHINALFTLEDLLSSNTQQLKAAGMLEMAILLRGLALARRGDVEEAFGIINTHITNEALSAEVKALAYYQRSRVYYSLGQLENAMVDSLNALNSLDSIKSLNSSLYQRLHYSLGVYYSRIGRYALSVLSYQRSIEFLSPRDRTLLADIELGLGQTFVLMKSPELATKHLEIALGIYQDLHDHKAMANTLHNLSRCKYLRGDYEGARNMVSDALSLHRSTRSMRGVAYDYIELARCSLALGEFDLAIQLSKKAATTFEAIDDEGQIARAYLNKVDAMSQKGDDLSGLESDVVFMIDIFEKRNWIGELAKISNIYAEYLLKTGLSDRAYQMYKSTALKCESFINELISTD